MLVNGYINATEFLKCQLIADADGENDKLCAGPFCEKRGTAGTSIRIGIFNDNECTNMDPRKNVEELLTIDAGE